MIEPKIRPDAPGTQPGEVGNGRVLIVDERTQKFNGIFYYRYPSTNRYFAKVHGKNLSLNIEVWKYHNGEVPEGYVVHHEHRKPDGTFDTDENNIEWLRLMEAGEHTAYHSKYLPLIDKICAWCDRPFQTKYVREIYCSKDCLKEAKRLKGRQKYRDSKAKLATSDNNTAPIVRNTNSKEKPVTHKRDYERYMEYRECPFCGEHFKVDKYSEAVVCSKPDCVSKAIKFALAQKRVMKNKLERNDGIRHFSNKELGIKIRCMLIDGKPWFVGKDVAKSLGYKDTVNALKDHVKPAEKQKIDLTKVDLAGVANHHPYSDATFKPASLTTIINQSGLFRLIFESKLPIAEMFKDWFLDKVLPRLFELGKYLSTTINPAALPAPEQTVETIDVTPSDQ